MAQILAVAQQKGGAGKTTLAAHLAVVLSEYGLSVTLVDVDPQQSLSQWHQIRERLGEHVTPLSLVTTDSSGLRSELTRVKLTSDFVIIDSPPHASDEARSAIRYADMVLVPMQPSPLDLWATQATIKMAKREKTPVKMVLNRVNAQARLSQKMREEMQDMSLSLFGNRVAYASALLTGKGVTESAPNSTAAKEIERFADDLLAHFDYDVEEIGADTLSAAAG